MQELLRSRNRKLLGVAGGCANHAGTDPVLWRAIWVLGGLFVPPLILAYIILGLVLPMEEPGTAHRVPTQWLVKSRDRWLGGVAGGVADYLELDPLLARLLFVAAACSGGVGVLIYLVLYALMPTADYSYGYYQTR